MQFLPLLVSGVAQGCIYGLIALGFALVYKATPSASRAQRTLMVAVTVLGLAAMALLDPSHWLDLPFQDELLQWNRNATAWATPGLNAAHLVVIGTTSLLCVLLLGLFRYGKLGMALQASSQNRLAAYYAGIPVRRLNGTAWGLAVALFAMVGLLLAPRVFEGAALWLVGLKAIPASVLGGWGSLPGAVVGGLVVGLLESLSGVYLPDGIQHTTGYVVAALMLLVKPQGLWGAPQRGVA